MNWDRPILRDLFWFWALPQRFARWLEAERRRLKAMIDTADEVYHEPTGETWIVACVEHGKLSWCGWPEGMADLADCRLLRKATAHERRALLEQLASMDATDHRSRYARHTLAQEASEGWKIDWSLFVVIGVCVAFLGVLAGCYGKAQETHETINKDYKVELLFEHDGCKVYRFTDGYDRYFTTCRGSTESTHVTYCGKGCIVTHPDSITTEAQP